MALMESRGRDKLSQSSSLIRSRSSSAGSVSRRRQRRTRSPLKITSSSGRSGGGSGGLETHSLTSGEGSVRIHRLPSGFISGSNSPVLSRFPKLEECAHFHYEYVELGPLQVSLYEDEQLKSLSLPLSNVESNENAQNKWIMVKVVSQGQSWLLRRTYENFRTLDQQLHQCVYDRKFSALPQLPPLQNLPDKSDPQGYIKKQLRRYCERFSCIAGSLMNCAPVLSWFQLDNRGRRILVMDNVDDNCCSINTPAVAAAYAIKKYAAVASDEISFDIGDMISVIDMPPPEDSIWWRGKKGFLVGFFPANCVAVITDKVPRNVHLNQPMTTSATGITTIEPTKPVLRKHGKLIAFFRAFILSRPSRRHLKQVGILKERVFGCDLGEHLLNTGRDVPLVLKCCSEFIEKHGLVDGIYRLSGVTSNIQKLRTTFDEDRLPALYGDENIVQDIHSVASLLKMYFRELPNPLCTYQLYKSFVLAVQHSDEKERIVLMKDTIRRLPPPHYRTLEYLMKHLSRVSEHGERTGMTARNIAIVWAPNLLRCKELEVGGVAALQGVGVQAVVTEFLITHVDAVFSVTNTPVTAACPRRLRPKSLSIGTPAKLLSLEEAQSRNYRNEETEEPGYIEVGGGPSCLPEKYHTVIELPSSRKRPPLKRSPLGWKSLFTRGTVSSMATSSLRKPSFTLSSNKSRNTSSSSDEPIGHRIINVTPLNATSEARNKLRTVKSAESLSNRMGMSCSIVVSIDHHAPPTSPKLSTSAGSRSVSHDSYLDHLEDEPRSLHDEALSDLQANFSLDESEMKIFSEEDLSSSRVFGNDSSFEQRTLKQDDVAQLASSENTITAESSPKKHKTSDSGSFGSVSFLDDVTAVSNKRSRLEERLSGVDFAFIDVDSLPKDQHHTEEMDVSKTDETLPTPSSPLMDTMVCENDTLSASTYTGRSPDSTAATVSIVYTPMSEESSSDYSRVVVRSRPSSIASTYCWAISAEQESRKYENVPRTRRSYQGDCGSLRNGLRNDMTVQEVGSKSLTNLQPNSSDRAYEYVSVKVDKSNSDRQSQCSVAPLSQNHKYEYIYPRDPEKVNTEPVTNSNSDSSESRLEEDSHHLDNVDSPYELVSVVGSKLTPVSCSERAGLFEWNRLSISGTPDYEEVSPTTDGLGHVTSNGDEELSLTDDCSSSLTEVEEEEEEAMVENNLYESLVSDEETSTEEPPHMDVQKSKQQQETVDYETVFLNECHTSCATNEGKKQNEDEDVTDDGSDADDVTVPCCDVNEQQPLLFSSAVSSSSRFSSPEKKSHGDEVSYLEDWRKKKFGPVCYRRPHTLQLFSVGDDARRVDDASTSLKNVGSQEKLLKNDSSKLINDEDKKNCGNSDDDKMAHGGTGDSLPVQRSRDRWHLEPQSVKKDRSAEKVPTVIVTTPSSYQRFVVSTNKLSPENVEPLKTSPNNQTDDEIVRRERIEKYKEERRLLLRQKYNTGNIPDDYTDEQLIRRYKQIVQKHSPTGDRSKSSENLPTSATPKNGANVTTISILYSPTKNTQTPKRQYCGNSSEHEVKPNKNGEDPIFGRERDWKIQPSYTTSLERRRPGRFSADGFVAERVNQLSAAVAASSCEQFKKSSAEQEKTSPTSVVRQRSHSTSGYPVTQCCIKDIAAVFEKKEQS